MPTRAPVLSSLAGVGDSVSDILGAVVAVEEEVVAIGSSVIIKSEAC